MSAKKSHSQFVSEFEAINPNIEVLGNYVNSKTRILVRCRVCGHEWSPSAGSLLQGTGCPACAGNLKKTQEQFNAEVETINPNVEVIGKYTGHHNKIHVRCMACGFEWTPFANSLLKGYGCPSCANHIPRSKEQFVAELTEINPDVEVLGEYVNTQTKVEVRCKTCGHIWSPVASSLLQGTGCSKCARRRIADSRRKTQSQFVDELAEKNPYIEVVGRYIASQAHIRVRCGICGHEWDGIPLNLLHGMGCPNCSHVQTSFVEQFIFHALERSLGARRVRSRDRKAAGIELDVYVPEKRLAIEFGSWFWHSNKLDDDAQKRRRCTELGIRLITVYDCMNTTKDVYGLTDVIGYSINLAAPESRSDLISLTNMLLAECDYTSPHEDSFWRQVARAAYRSSRRKTTKQFMEEVYAANPCIVVSGEYRSTSHKVSVRCKECGHEWEAYPSNLLRGHGCPACAGRAPKTQAQFVSQLTNKNPDIEVLGSYVNSGTKVHVRCKTCRHEWDSLPGNLLKGNHCPECAKAMKARKRRKSREQLVTELSVKNPDIQLVGDYTNTQTKVRVRCKACGNEWDAYPNNLLRGHGCPLCGRNKGKHGGRRRRVLCVETGVIYDSMIDAARDNGMKGSSNLARACNDEAVTVSGFHWRYV